MATQEEKAAARKAEREAEDLRYISNPDSWVSFSLCCPVKRWRDRQLECAYLIGDGPNLYHGNIWARSEDDRKEEFKDFRAIIDAGWQVD